MSKKQQFEFYGIATVSVSCFVEAESEEEAMEKVANGDCEWECDCVDGEVSDIECMS